MYVNFSQTRIASIPKLTGFSKKPNLNRSLIIYMFMHKICLNPCLMWNVQILKSLQIVSMKEAKLLQHVKLFSKSVSCLKIYKKAYMTPVNLSIWNLSISGSLSNKKSSTWAERHNDITLIKYIYDGSFCEDRVYTIDQLTVSVKFIVYTSKPQASSLVIKCTLLSSNF